MVGWPFCLRNVFPETIQIILIRNQRKLEGGKGRGREAGERGEERQGEGGGEKRGGKEMYHL